MMTVFKNYTLSENRVIMRIIENISNNYESEDNNYGKDL